MGKDKDEEAFDLDSDSQFNDNFLKNIDKVLNDTDVIDHEPANLADRNQDDATKDSSNYAENNMSTSEESEVLQRYPEGDNEESGFEDELTNISASLAKQICEELNMNTEDISKTKRKKMPRWQKIVNIVSVVLLILVASGLFLGMTKPGHKLLLKVGVNLGGKIWATWTKDFDDDKDLVEDTDFLEEDDYESDHPEADLSQVIWPDHPGDGRHEDGVYNILLLGEESIGSESSRGRTDVIIIATLNVNQKAVRLTSLLRDTLVQIPGYKENKLNSAYEKGGLELLYQTISMNFDIRLDGAVMVNFKNFEKIVDRLGGLELTLTSGEAKYLNKTNYISDKKNRTVVEGTQHMNGNQVLGYARIRKRATITGNNNDYGRTDRHRIVLNAIFEKYKTKSKVELAGLMLGILPMITTDIDQKNFESMLNTFIQMGTMEIEQLRLPANGTFTDNIEVRGMDVLIPDYEENVDILHNFVFGEDKVDTAENTESSENTNNVEIKDN
ncbi:MAG: hypothetical protein K0S76_1289 [Herbinix sp.]|nr:hypothetical protein [Herbinix sp.]